MHGSTRAEIDKIESADIARGRGPLRPRDAATLILLERVGGAVRVLMGRRHRGHAFMPGKFVFPGGRTDPSDSRVPVVHGLHPDEEAKLAAGRSTAARARAIALSAVRETYEEAGLMIGLRRGFSTGRPEWQGFAEHGVHPSLETLRYVARAITPPGRVRRFDTRFLAAWRGDVAVELPGGGPTQELEELVWLPIADAKAADIPAITRSVLDSLETRLSVDPELAPGASVPFFRMHRNRFIVDMC
ncbi:MAG: NUDIX domain-containing protein [Rhizobiaceae bacterium]|nr:NUDIX domain-containing protein [Rhizobiaceae bacterium]